jgi:hypothetical protein
MILEGWSANVNCVGASTDWIDHTWVYSPGNDRYFACWGGHDGPNKRRIVAGNGSYDRADCYRCPVWPFPDTAGIGVFAVDGVCHQSTNCFLYTANRTLNFAVRGYWFSLFSYGTFGRSYRRWRTTPYGRCTGGTPTAMLGTPKPQEAPGLTREREGEDATIRAVREVYAPAMMRGARKHRHELLADEVAAVTRLHAPEVNPDQFRDIHRRYLRRKDELIASGHRAERLAERLDDLARKTQQELSKRIGREHYERLMGVPADVTLGLVEPALAAAAGVPADLPAVFPAQASREDEAGSCRASDGTPLFTGEGIGRVKAEAARWLQWGRLTLAGSALG